MKLVNFARPDRISGDVDMAGLRLSIAIGDRSRRGRYDETGGVSGLRR